MYKLIVRKDNIEQEYEFESAELAQLYRDYHLAFGHWNGISKWIHEKELTEEKKRFVVDERTELENGIIVRFFKLTEGIELKIEQAIGNSIDECWIIIRNTRNKLLQETDWTQLPDISLGMDEKKEYRNYRAYLRTLPTLHNSDSIVKAKVYSFEEWKNGKR